MGSAVDFDERFRLHILQLNNNKHHNRHLQAAWNEYGEDQFKFYIIEICYENLLEREQHWIKHLNCTDHSIGYNICEFARNRKGVKASEETRSKLSISHKGNKLSEETKRKMSLARIGNQINKGRKQTEEHVAKRVKLQLGQKRSDEARARMSAIQKGRKFSEEARRNMSIAAKNRRKNIDERNSL